jgi:hypothetical protein
MYARPLFVVVGIFEAFLARFDPPDTILELRLGMSGSCGYTLAA